MGRVKVPLKSRIKKEALLRDFQDLARELNRIPDSNDIDEASKAGKCASYTTYARTFFFLTSLYREAGMPIEAKVDGRRYTYDDLMDQLLNLRRKLGRRLTESDVRKAMREKECARIDSFKRVFKSIDIALMRAEKAFVLLLDEGKN